MFKLVNKIYLLIICECVLIFGSQITRKRNASDFKVKIRAGDETDLKLPFYAITTTFRSTTIFDYDMLSLDDVLIGVKTSRKYHDNQLSVILRTWFQLAKSQTWFFTDQNDWHLQRLTGQHVVNTDCPNLPENNCCKTSAQFSFFATFQKKWHCFFEDDVYVNIPNLLSELQNFNYNNDYYVGKSSSTLPIREFPRVQRRFNSDWLGFKPYGSENVGRDNVQPKTRYKKIHFKYAQGSAGFCLSQPLLRTMMPFTGDGKLLQLCDSLKMPDDVTVGYIVATYAKSALTDISGFHAHGEDLTHLDLLNEISLPYEPNNLLKADLFTHSSDPTRFYSVHCLIFPYVRLCKKLREQTSANKMGWTNDFGERIISMM